MKHDRVRVDVLLSVLDGAYDRRSWHGTNLRGSIRGLSAARAIWRPSPSRHNIWELVVHAAYWKYAVWRRLTGGKKGAFPLKGSNWFRRSDGSAEPAWREDVALLHRMHGQLRDAVERLSDRDLALTSPPSAISHAEIIAGIAAHDLYHAGQIQLLKKLRARGAPGDSAF